jgi:hypothetical protein
MEEQVLNLLAIISGLLGAISLIASLWTWSLVGFISGLFMLLNSYIWSIVRDLWVDVDNLKRKESENQ